MSDLITLLDDAGADDDVFWSGESPPEPAAPQRLTAAPAIQPLPWRRGDRGPAVTFWQTRLRELGFDPGAVDGRFGLKTESATKAFQKSRSLSTDGVVGLATLAAASEQAPPPPAPTAIEVPRVRTPLTATQLVTELRAGHIARLGAEPSWQRLGCAWAQVAFEHGHGFHIWCNNIGNITAFSWPANYYMLSVRERVSKDPDIWKTLHVRFRAHTTAADGMSDYWRLLSGARYSSVLPFFDAGDPRGAALELGRRGYYTDYPEHYASQMSSLYREFMREFAQAA